MNKKWGSQNVEINVQIVSCVFNSENSIYDVIANISSRSIFV